MDIHESTPSGASRPQEPRVPFADGASDTIPLSWAEEGLRWLYANRRQVFGDMLLARLGIEKKTPGRKPADQQ